MVDFGNLILFDVFDIVYGEELGEWDGKIVMKSVDFIILVCKVVDEFRVFVIFVGENFFEFEDGGIKWGGIVVVEDVVEGVEDVVVKYYFWVDLFVGVFGDFEGGFVFCIFFGFGFWGGYGGGVFWGIVVVVWIV